MKRKAPHRFTDGSLYICTGGNFGPRVGKWHDEIDPATLSLDDQALVAWYDRLPQDGGYRFRAGRFQGKQWAEISVEFNWYDDAVEPWTYICTAPADEKGNVVSRIDRRPCVSLYWRHLERVVAEFGTMETIVEGTDTDRCWVHPTKPGITDLASALKFLESVKKSHPRKICTLEKYDRTGEIVVACYGRNYGRKTRQVDVSLPIRTFATRAEIKNTINVFLDALGAATPDAFGGGLDGL